MKSSRTIFTLLCAAAAILGTQADAAEKTSFKFAFGEAAGGTNWTRVAPTNLYSADSSYGFEPGTDVIAVEKQFVTGGEPFYFSVKLPEGNYRVTVALGDTNGESTTTIKSELRRLMLEKVHTAKGEIATRSFNCNVRTPRISATNSVHLKKREIETEMGNWDEKLTLEFNDARPCLRSLEIAPASVPTVFVLGDSTVCDQPAEPWNSWGQMLPRFLKPDVCVANNAESGESIKSSLGAHRFDKVFATMKTNDWLLLQFGHNDMKDRATNALATYKANLKKIVARTRSLGGTPVLIPSMERKGGAVKPTLKDYPETVREVAREDGVAMIDLNAMSLEFYHALGTNLNAAFQDPTHHNNYGSYELAKCVVMGIKSAKLPLAKSIVDDFTGFDPAHPDAVETFLMPASAQTDAAKPEGN